MKTPPTLFSGLRVAGALLLGLAGPVRAQLAVTFDVSTAPATRQPISPLVYGTNQPQQAADNYGSVRQGGNRTTGYNWENNASNAGSDYVHQSDTYACYAAGLSAADCDVPGKVVASFVQGTRARPGAPAPLVTLQMAGYVAADKNNTSVSPAETAPSARWHPVLARQPGARTYPPNLADNAVYMDEQVQYLANTFGPAAQGGAAGYFLDNEPALWASTHPRLHPAPVGAAELWTKSRDLAAAVKDVDPTADVYGGVFYGFAEYLNLQNAPDWAAQGAGYLWFVDYYLAKLQAASATDGRRLLDVLDVHWYPEATGLDNGAAVRIVGNNTSAAVREARMQAPRTLWQPGYRETSWIAQYYNQFLPLLPSLQRSIAARYPGTRLSVSEYCYGGCGDISGGLAQADVLGIFGRSGVHNANWWDDCGAGTRSYISPAFRLYTNYDGAGARFGSTAVAATTTDAAATSVYAAIAGANAGRLTLVVLNKAAQPVQGTFALGGGTRYASGRAWGFDDASPALVARPAVSTLNAAGDAFTYTLPALSATTFELLAGPLPVVLTDFTAQWAPGTTAVALRWGTASEHAARQFVVERAAADEPTAFRPLLAVPATNTAGPHRYAARDETPHPGPAPSYYRLRLVDEDGTATFSPVVALAAPAVAAPTLTAWPNPAPAGSVPQLAVQLGASAPAATLLATDAQGRQLLARPLGQLPSGATALPLPEAAGWPAGLYLLTLRTADGGVVRRKLSVE